MEIELESVRVQLEEEAEARLDLERQLSKANQDCLSWKSKYDQTCLSHTEEIEEIRYFKKIWLTSEFINGIAHTSSQT